MTAFTIGAKMTKLEKLLQTPGVERQIVRETIKIAPGTAKSVRVTSETGERIGTVKVTVLRKEGTKLIK